MRIAIYIHITLLIILCVCFTFCCIFMFFSQYTNEFDTFFVIVGILFLCAFFSTDIFSIIVFDAKYHDIIYVNISFLTFYVVLFSFHVFAEEC